MSPLEAEIRELIATEGPMPVDRYMALCLGHPEHGYYMTRDPLGVRGDFTTAPEISQMFGELVGLFMADVWQKLGSPPRVQIVECGPGRGTLMADALRAMKAMPGLRAAADVHLIEISPTLRRKQLAAMVGADVTAHWHETLDELPTDTPILLVANEFLDALPVKQFQHRDGRWHERLVGLADDRLIFGLSAAPEVTLNPKGRDGDILELPGAGLAWTRAVASRLAAQGGAALIMDYGHDGDGFGETLQAVRRHAFADPLADPGLADLTAHVNFKLVAAAAAAAGADVHGPIEQGWFLENLGIRERATALIAAARTADQRSDIAAAADRLTDMSARGMGSLFKVLGLSQPGLILPGVAPADSPSGPAEA